MSRGYDETKPVRIWVGSYALYNAGYLAGDWFSLPMDRDELWAGIKEACRLSPFNEEVGCFDYECDMSGVREHMSEYMCIDSVNALAAAIENANEWEMEAAEAYVSNECGDLTTTEVANIIMNADDISYSSYAYEGNSPEERYGMTMVYDLNPELAQVLEKYNIESYFDFEAYGRDTDDTLLDEGYLWSSGDEPSKDDYTALEILERFGYYTPSDEEVA